MKILLVINKTLKRGNKHVEDLGYKTVFIPLKDLGHDVSQSRSLGVICGLPVIQQKIRSGLKFSIILEKFFSSGFTVS